MFKGAKKHDTVQTFVNFFTPQIHIFARDHYSVVITLKLYAKTINSEAIL